MQYKVRATTLRLYRAIFSVIDTRGGLAVALFFGHIFRGFTPAFAEPYRIEQSGRFLSWTTGFIFVAALIHTLFLTMAVTAYYGTFNEIPGSPLGFIEDKWNIALYSIICPAYVTLCIRMIILAMERDASVDHCCVEHSTDSQARRLFVSLFTITLLSSVLITSYVSDALDPKVISVDYWFIETIDGVRRLNGAGLFYIVLNFCLLFLTFLGGSAFISISIDGIQLSRKLVEAHPDLNFKSFRQRLDRLVFGYYLGVGLVVCYALNIIIWKHSPLGETANIHIAGAILTILGIFFVTVPRRFIEHTWAVYCVRRSESLGEEEVEHQEIISSEASRNINTVQFLCVAGWLPNFYEFNSYIDPYYWMDLFFKQ